MIYFLTTKYHLGPITSYLQTIGKEPAGLIRPVVYNRFIRWREKPSGTYIFSDIDRLSPRFAERLARVCDEMAKDGRYRVLNHPTRSLTRYALLNKLKAVRINNFTAYRADSQPRPARFPVFIRREDDHAGARSLLLEDQESLESALDELVAEGASLRDKIVVEYCAEPDEHGRFFKFGCIRIGSRIVTSQCYASRHWEVKYPDLIEPDVCDLELALFRSSPHLETLRRATDLAGIQFCRMDYAIVGGEIQVYEINTNPTLCTPRGLEVAPERQKLNCELSGWLKQSFRAINSGPPPSLMRKLRERLR